MDASLVNCITPEAVRLISYAKNPLANNSELKFNNSPVKFARSGFSRLPDAKYDEVTCEQCQVTYSGWDGESPLAVHRVLSEECPFLSTPSETDIQQRHHLVQAARRRLFVDSGHQSDSQCQGSHETSSRPITSPSSAGTDKSVHKYVSVLSAETMYKFPYEPKIGGAKMLFATRRLKTFTGLSRCERCKKLADDGFVYISATDDVQCVFCGAAFAFNSFEDVHQKHLETSLYCPMVQLKDVGNISIQDEENIKKKHLLWQLKQKVRNQPYTIAAPQFEELNSRIGTFKHWPHSVWDVQLQPTNLSDAGFYYTGYTDKVKCYCCGLALTEWQKGSNPWEQHYLHMPTCPHLQSKGGNYLQQAAQAQVLTKAEFPLGQGSKEGSSTVCDLLTPTPPGSHMMDIAALSAALDTSQYSDSDILQALLTYFFRTSRYPNKEILLGQLRAADINFPALCKQRELNHQKDAIIQEKDSVIQQKDSVIQQKDSVIQQVIQQKDSVIQQVIQQKDSVIQQVIQQKDSVIQQKDSVIQQVIQQKDSVIQQKDSIINNFLSAVHQKDTELLRSRRIQAYQEQQIKALELQLQSNRLHFTQSTEDVPTPVQQQSPERGTTTCKVCLTEEISTHFKPCHHVSCCKSCAQQLITDLCPVCRVPITKVLPAFLA